MRTPVLIKVVLTVLLVSSGFLQAAPVIKEFSSKGGHTQNKNGSKDIMYLAKPGDKITFSVKADGAEKYVWQVNKKVQDKATGETFVWTVPNKKGIWEIHLNASGGGKETHQEWVVSTLSKAEAPEFFDYFTDLKFDKRTEADPWGRKLPEWRYRHPGRDDPVEARRGSMRQPPYDTKKWIKLLNVEMNAASGAGAYGTWRFRMCVSERSSRGVYGGALVWYSYAGRGGVYDVCNFGYNYWGFPKVDVRMDYDSKFYPKPKEWYDFTIIRPRDGFIYTYVNGVLQYRWYIKDGGIKTPAGQVLVEFRRYPPDKRYAKPDTSPYPNTFADLDCLETYTDKYLFPKKEIKYGEYIDNYKWDSQANKWQPIKKMGIVVTGRNVRLEDVVRAINDPSVLKYDEKTATAVCYTNLVVGDGAELIIEGKTLKIHSSKPGEHEFRVKYAASLRINKSTVTSANDNHFAWRLTSTSDFGYPVHWLVEKLGKGARFNPQAYESMQSIHISDSTIDNCSYMFFESPWDLCITNSKLTNLVETDIGEYSFYQMGGMTDESKDEGRKRKEFVRGKKGLWILLKERDIAHFDLNKLVISGKKSPLDVTIMVNNEIERLNLYNVDMKNENLVVRKSVAMTHYWKSMWPFWYDSTVGLVNSRVGSLKVPTDKARIVPKYYLDVKVVTPNGMPVKDATISVKNEVDDENYPAENIIYKREHIKKNPGWNLQIPTGYRVSLYSANRSVATGADGHTPFPSDKEHTMILPDFVQDKDGKKEFTYTITVEKDGKKKVIKGVDPGPKWYRPAPNTPTHTITLVLAITETSE